MHTYHRAWSIFPSIVLVATTMLFVGGCEEKKTCYFQCYEPALDGFDEGNCGHMEQATEVECGEVEFCDDRRSRRSWGDLPSWCEGPSKPNPSAPDQPRGDANGTPVSPP